MLKTQQTALVQATNQQLILIRQNEMTYYLNIVSIFGQQAALIAGFAYSSMTQISFSPLTGFLFYSYAQDVFWISTALCMGVSVHVILTTSYLQIYAQGLSIHGPIGSMARAVYGLRQETKEIFVVYIIMVISFAVSMLFSFWTVMTIRAAAVCTAFFLFVSIQWWRYCLRIYNKFYVKRLFYLAGEPTTNEERDPTKPVKKMSPMEDKVANEASNKSESSGGFFSSIFGGSSKSTNPSSLKETVISDEAAQGHFAEHLHGEGIGSVFHQGYLSMNENEILKKRTVLQTSKSIAIESWVRRYFVVNDEGEMYYYHDHTKYHKSPDQPIRTRPLRLCEYDVKVGVSLPSASDSTKSCPPGGSSHFDIVLEYQDKDEGVRPWYFRCDSVEEQNMWLEVFRQASKFDTT